LYIESDYFKTSEGKSVLQPGTQRLIIPPNPYTLFGDLEAEEAKRLFQVHDYNGAQRIFLKLAGKLPDNKSFSLYADLSEGYDAWEVLDFKRSAKKLGNVVENINHDPLIQKYAHPLREQLISVTELAGITSTVNSDDRNSKQQVLSDHNKILHLLSTLRAIAERRASDGRYDVAALYLYRSIELISQHRLARYHCLASDIDYSQVIDPQSGQLIPRSTLKTRYIAEHRFVVNARLRRNPNDRSQLANDLPGKKPGLFASYNLLAALNDPLIQNYNWIDIEVRTESRNNSILAHGYRLITSEEYQNFAQVANELYTRLVNLYGESQADWQTRSQFIQPFNET
jgi:CRISPR-associated protein (TIGR02710 family)